MIATVKTATVKTATVKIARGAEMVSRGGAVKNL